MSEHSYSRCWIHLVWATLRRMKSFNDSTGSQLSEHLKEYSKKNQIYIASVYANPDHVHAMIDLPTNLSIEQVIKLYKGESSHWINQNRIVLGKFYWGRGYGAFSVSQSKYKDVVRYIKNQKQHHQHKMFADELREFVNAYGLVWRDEDGSVQELGNR